MDDAEKHAVIARYNKSFWWHTPLVLFTIVGPPLFFLWGYFDAARWIIWIPALSHLGAPLFVAMGLGVFLRIVLWFGGVSATAHLHRTFPRWSNDGQHWAGFAFIIFLIVLQNAPLAKIAPTFVAGYGALACVLSIVLNRPKWAYYFEPTKSWVRQDQIRHAMYFAALFGAIAALNLLFALVYSTGSWVVFRVAAHFMMLALSGGSVFLFRNAYRKEFNRSTP